MSEYEDLDSFGVEYAPQHAFRPSVETLANGDYDFEVVDAKLGWINADRVCRVGLRVLSAGRVVEHTYWLNRQAAVNGFAADLAALGFPASSWGPGKVPLSQAIPAAVAKLPGVRFRATKSSRTGKDGRAYHELHVGGRISGAPMPPAMPLSQPTRPAMPPVGIGAAGDDADIPF